MRIIRGLAAAAILACGALGFAGPAHADQVMQGVYNYTPQEGDSGTYEIWPSCVPVVGDLRVAAEPAGRLPAAHVPVDRAHRRRREPDRRHVAVDHAEEEGMPCPDGSWAPTIETVRFDDLTMTGTRTIAHNDVCGLPPGIVSMPFTMSYKGTVADPVQQYPLYCEPGGLRRCF